MHSPKPASRASEQRKLVRETAQRVALEILESRTGIEALHAIAEAARRLAHARYAALGVANPSGPGLQEFVTVGLTREEELAISHRPFGTGLLGALLQSTSPIRLSDVAAHPSSVGFPQNHPPMRSFLGVPIRRGSVTIGSLYLAERDGGGEFTTEDEAAVQALGAYAGIAVHNLHMLAKQRSLVNGLINAQEEERRAVAYDLHDGLTQYVMAAHAHLETHRRALEDGDEARASRESETGIRYLKEAVIESRRLISGLRTLALDDVGLAGALDQLVQEEKDRAGWKEADFDQNLGRRRFGYPLETAAYRIAQEALTNARKHAGAGHVEVRLLLERSEYSSGERLRLSVSDDGEGFVVESKAGDYSRVGLHGMAERARILDAEFEVRSAPGEGTRVAVTFPVTPDAAG